MRPEDFDDNRSVWAATAPADSPSAALVGEVHADVAIIGGGFTGVSTARELLRRDPNLGVVLLEARTLGNGASGRNGGQLLNWINGVGDTDPVLTKRVWEVTNAGIDGVLARAQASDAVRWRRDGALECYTEARRAEHAHERVERLNGWGIPLRYVQGEELRRLSLAEGVVGAVFDPTAGLVSGLDLIRATKPELVRAGVRVYENTPVTRVEERETITLQTPNGIVRCKALVLGVGGYAGLIGYFNSGVFPLISHAVSVPIPPEQWGEANAFCDDMDRISYAAREPAGNLVFGGGSNAAYSYHYGGRTAAPTGDKELRAMRERLGTYFPGVASVAPNHAWSGVLSITMSRRCSIGRRGNVYWGLGFSGHGVTLGNLAGEVIADLYTGNGEKWADIPFLNCPFDFIPPDPFRWVGYHVFTALTGKSPRAQ